MESCVGTSEPNQSNQVEFKIGEETIEYQKGASAGQLLRGWETFVTKSQTSHGGSTGCGASRRPGATR